MPAPGVSCRMFARAPGWLKGGAPSACWPGARPSAGRP